MANPSITIGALCIIAVCGCRDEPSTAAAPTGTSTGRPAFTSASIAGSAAVSVSERNEARRIARALAIALQDPSARDELKMALASSAVRESKLHFSSFLTGRGALLLSAMERNGHLSDSDLRSAISRVRDMELYMPVRSHREHWSGDEVPAVALALTGEEAPEAFDGAGASKLLNRVYAPKDPVLVLAPVETNFASQIAANLIGRPERPCISFRTEALATASDRCGNRGAAPKNSTSAVFSTSSAASDSVVGIYATEIVFADDECGSECWAWGDPEYEIHTYGKLSPSDSELRHIQCSADLANTSYQPGIRNDGEFNYDQNGRQWSGKVKLLDSAQMNAIQAADSGWKVYFWEDDTDRCRIAGRLGGDAAEAFFLAGSSTVTAIAFNRPELLIGGVVGTVALIADLFNGGDDEIGMAIEKSKSPYSDRASPSNNMVIIGDHGQYKGRATFKLYTRAGVFVGPAARVSLSMPNGTKMPLGYTRNYQVAAFDAYENAVTGRTITWSSSNASIASVDEYGTVTGNGTGTATLTATVDGVSGSSTVNVVALGPPDHITVTPTGVSLAVGASMTPTVRTYDSNHFELPVSDTYRWISNNPGVCSVNLDGTITAHSTGSADITVDSEGMYASLICSTGGEWSRVPADGGTLTGSSSRTTRAASPSRQRTSRTPR